MADIAKMLMQAINNYEKTRQSNMRMNQQQNQFNQRNFMANKLMKQRGAQFASKQELQSELAGMRERGAMTRAGMYEAGRDRRAKESIEAKRSLSPKELIAMKAKEQSFIKNMGKPQIYEPRGPLDSQYSTGTRSYDNPFASVTGGPKTVKQPIIKRPKATKSKPKIDVNMNL